MTYAMVVIHYHAPDSASALISASRSWLEPPQRIIVVDNSRDFADKAAADLIAADDLMIVPSDNLGYGHAANIGTQAAIHLGFDYVLLCTQDAQLESDASRRLLATIRSNSRNAVAAPLLEFASSPGTIFSAGGTLSRRGIGRHSSQGQPNTLSQSGEQFEISWADGAVLMLDTAKFLAVGGFDPSYFLYVEEVDLQFRLRSEGFRVIMNSAAIARQEPGAYTDYLRYRNHVYFTRKYRKQLSNWPWPWVFVRDIARATVKRRTFKPSKAILGVRDAYRGRMGVPS